MKLILSGDLHGNIIQYKRLIEYSVKNEIHTIFICGDNSPRKRWHKRWKKRFKHLNGKWSKEYDGVRYYKLFFHFYNNRDWRYDFFICCIYSQFKNWAEMNSKNRAFICFGNSDLFSTVKKLVKNESIHPRVKFIHNSIVNLNDEYDLMCYSCTNVESDFLYRTGFSVGGVIDSTEKKRSVTVDVIDFKRFDRIYKEEKIFGDFIVKGFTSIKNKKIKEEFEKVGYLVEKIEKNENSGDLTLVTFKYNYEKKFTIYDELKEISKGINKKKKLIFMSHCPPINTDNSRINLPSDKYFEGGSMCIRDFIEEQQPTINFVGHIHLCINSSKKKEGNFVKTGIGDEKIKNTVVISPGNVFDVIEKGEEGFSKTIALVDIEISKKGILSKRILYPS